jgi:NHS family xanthosine MFS transporter
MMMVNGFGAVSGSLISGYAIQKYFTLADGITKNWNGIWLTFAIYSLIVAILFAILFKHKHQEYLDVIEQ